MTLFFPTQHLIEKLKLRNVTWAEVVDICEAPEVVYGPDKNGCKVLQKGDLSVVLAPGNAVVTVLLRDAEKWNDEDVRSREKFDCGNCGHKNTFHDEKGCVEEDCGCGATNGRLDTPRVDFWCGTCTHSKNRHSSIDGCMLCECLNGKVITK